MKDAIIHKLTMALTNPIITEAQAVYVLVELRKLLDRRKKEAQLPGFLNIRFCCDWAVHVQLHEYHRAAFLFPVVGMHDFMQIAAN